MDTESDFRDFPEPDLTIEPGDQVRSFDFDLSHELEGDQACYVEGVVTGIQRIRGCNRYMIVVEKRVFAGEEVDRERLVFPPVNGTEGICGPQANVVLLEKNVLEIEKVQG